MNRATLIAERTSARAAEICAAIPPIKPGPQYWLTSDAGPDYCRPCVIVARGHEFELGPLLVEPDYWWDRDDWHEAYFEGIEGGRDIESDNAAHCSRCGENLSYILTDYGAEQEASYWLDAPLIQITPADSYDLERLTLNVFDGMARRRLLTIAAAVGQAYRLFQATTILPSHQGAGK